MSDAQGKKPKAPPIVEKRPVTHSFTPSTAYDVSIPNILVAYFVIIAYIGGQIFRLSRRQIEK